MQMHIGMESQRHCHYPSIDIYMFNGVTVRDSTKYIVKNDRQNEKEPHTRKNRERE